MAEGQVYLDTLNTESRSYKVKGNKMRGALFGDQVSGHVDALVYNGVYEIANAPIKPMQDQYRRDPTELPYTMGFGRNTFIRPLSSATGPFLPDYESISQVPKTSNPYDTFDVVGTLLYVEPTAREINAKHGRANTVREVVLTDHSAEQPVVISAWNELAADDCDKLLSLVGSFLVVGFTALRVSTHKGTMSTSIDTKPTGDKVIVLTEWVDRSTALPVDLQARINGVRTPDALIRILTLSALKIKKAKSTFQDERYRLVVTVRHPQLQKVNAYLGCSNCGKRTDYAAGETFKCDTEPRVTFNCEVSDGTDYLDVTAFTDDTARLFCMSTSEIFHMKHSEDITIFGKVCTLLQTTPFTLKVSPKTSLSRNNILQWALRQVVVGPEAIADVLDSSQAEANVLDSPIVPDSPIAQPTDLTIVAAATSQAVPVARQLDFGETLEQPTNLTLVDVAVRADYPSPRRIPASLATETMQVHSGTPAGAVAPVHQPTPVAALPGQALVHQSPCHMTPLATSKLNMPVLRTPKVEKASACTPETPAQGTPKRATGKQPSETPTKKKKAAASSPAEE